MLRIYLVISCLLACGTLVSAEVDPPLEPGVYALPGLAHPTPFLRYANPKASSVQVVGDWDKWSERYRLRKEGDAWVINIEELELPEGRYAYKFLVQGNWEPGENRILYINEHHLLEAPPDLIRLASIENWKNIQVSLRKGVQDPSKLSVSLDPEIPITWRALSPADIGYPCGFVMEGSSYRFTMDESVYGLNLSTSDTVCVAGTFNAWGNTSNTAPWCLKDDDNDNVWTLTVPASSLQLMQGETEYLFKFVINATDWLHPPGHAENRVDDGKGNINLALDPAFDGVTRIEISPAEPLDLSRNYSIAIRGMHERTVRGQLTPGGIMYQFKSDKELGAILDKQHNATVYRLFAPRASSVTLNFYETPYHEEFEPEYTQLEPVESYPLWKDTDGVWEITLLGLDTGRYYGFNVAGPDGPGENFHQDAFVGDIYATAAAHAENCAIVMDRDETNEWWSGWTDHDWKIPKLEDLVIYEAHVRDLTWHPSSGVPEQRKGTYQAILDSLGTGTGLDHLKEMGFNALELLPINEFNNGTNSFNWGYTTTYYFAPEASYAQDPLNGSQFFEFKHFVNEMHREGIAVILDVVYNHVGYPNYFALIDRKYYFRLNPDYSFQNYSGVGNDFKSESPMARRMIVDNILYWMEEFHIDGFRFDLAELIDMETLMEIRDKARALNPDVILISEPWSFRGQHKDQLKGTGWSAWNNDFRYASKDFVRGRGDRNWIIKKILGSVESWAARPVQCVNYMESHDDMALADEISSNPGHDGRILNELDVAANRLGATMLFTSLGIPMVAEGQEFLRSKWGISNTYNKGDEVNALNWEDRNRPLAREAMAYYRDLIHLRQSAEGSSFRVRNKPPANYYRWVFPEDTRAVGYFVNSPNVKQDGRGFLVLLNGGPDPVSFQVELPDGTAWKQIADGLSIEPSGLPDAQLLSGPAQQTFTVEPRSSMIFMDGFNSAP